MRLTALTVPFVAANLMINGAGAGGREGEWTGVDLGAGP